MQRTLPHAHAAGTAAPVSRFALSENQKKVLRGLWPYVWPHDRPDLKSTVLWSLVLILIAKVVTVMVPYTLKWATDALVVATGCKLVPGEDNSWLVATPILATIFYCVARRTMTLLEKPR